MASPIDDPRYALARMMRSERQAPTGYAPLGPAPSKTGVALGRTASNMAAANPSLREAIDRIQSGKPAAPKGALGVLMNNPLTKVGLNALGALALPGKAVIAGLREGVDAIDANPDTTASFGEFKKNVKDPTFGFGKAFDIDTGNIWVDRAIGLVGDIALDPLTYVTFGAGKFAGYSGRLDLANVVLKNTGDSALANQIQRFGRAAIKDPAVLEAAGANRHGLYMLGKRIEVGQAGQGLRIPGSGAIGQFSDNALAKLRISAMGTKGGKFVQKITLPADNLAARQAMLQGQVGDEASGAVIGALTASPTARKAAGVALQETNRELLEKMGRAELAGLDSYSKDLYKYIENPELLATASKQIQDAYEEWAPGYFNRLDDNIGQRMAEVDPNHKYTGVKDYFPRMQTDAAVNYRSDPKNVFSRNINEIMDKDPLAGGQNFKTRTMEVGDDWFGHKLTVEDLKSTERLNELARPSLGGADFFETDIRIVANKYAASYADEVGLLAKHKHLADAGFWKRAEAVELGTEFIDKELISSVKKNIKSLSDDLTEAYKQSSKAYLGLVNALDDARGGKLAELKTLEGAGGALGARQALVDTQTAIDDVLNGSLTISADQLQTVVDNLGSLKNKFAGLFGAEVKNGKLVLKGTGEAAEDSPLILDGLVGYIDDLETDVQRLHEELFPLERDWVGNELRDAHAQASVKLKLASARIKESQDRIETIMEFGNQIESALESIARGETTGDLPNAVNTVLALIAKDGDLGNSTIKALQEEILGAKGSTEKFIRERLQDPVGLGKTTSMASPVSADNIAKMQITDFYNDIPGMFTNEHTLTHVREMSLFALLKDERLYGADAPELLTRMRSELIKQLRMADEADAFVARTAQLQSQTGRLSAAKIFETQWKGAFDRALNLNEEISSMTEFINRFRTGLAGNEDVLDNIVNWDSLTSDLQKYPWLSSMEPNMGATEFIEDLMGATEVVPRRGNMDLLDGDTFDLGGKTVADQQFTRGSYDEQITYADLLQRVEDRLGNNQQLMTGEFFEFNAGGAAKRYTGDQVLAVKREYDNVGEELQKIRTARTAAQESFKKDKGYDKLDLGTPNGRARRDALDLQADAIWPSKDSADKYTRLLDRQREISGGGSVLKPEWFAGAASTKESLGNSLMNYTIVSEVMARWSSMSEHAFAHGYVPTQRMFADITEAVGSKFLPIIDRQLVSTNIARDVVSRLDREIAEALSSNAGEARPSDIFRRFVTGLSTQERDILVDAVGTKIAWGADPYELRRGVKTFTKSELGDKLVKRRTEIGKEIKIIKTSGDTGTATTARLTALRKENAGIAKQARIAQAKYYAETVKPWFEKAYPGKTATKKNMDAALKAQASSTAKGGARRQFQTPWAVDADVATVKRFFEDIIGTSQIQGRGHTLGGKADSLTVKARNLRNAQVRFKGMLAPDLNVQQFFDDPSVVQRTPTFYSYMLQRSSDSLSRRIALKQGANFDILDLRAQQTSAGATALEKTQQVADIVGPYRGVQPTTVSKAQQDAIDKTQAAIDRIVAKPKISANEKARLAKLQDILATQKGGLTEASGLPKSFTESVRTSGIKTTQIEAADSSVSAAKKALDDIAELAKPLKNKKRTKAGLNKTETAKLAALEKRAGKAQTALATAREQRAALPSLTAPEKRAAELPKGVDYKELARKNVEEYNSMMESSLHAKAKGDEEMISAMDQLAGTYMHEYKTGFITNEGVVATMPNGQPIVFSDAEWRSLYTGSRNKVEADVRRTNLRPKVKSIETEIASMSQRKMALEVALVKAESQRAIKQEAIYNASLRGEGRGMMERYRKMPDLSLEIKKELDDITEAIKGSIKERDNLLTDIESFNSSTQNTALMKMRILVQGRKGQAPVFDKAGLQKFVSFEHPSQRAFVENTFPDAKLSMQDILVNWGKTTADEKVVKARQTGLQKSWTSTEEYKFLQKLSSIEDDTFVKMYKFMDDSVESMMSYRDAFDSRIGKVIEEARPVGEEARAMRTQAQEQARTGADVLKAETGRVPVAPTGEQLPIPTTPAEMDAYAASLAEQAKPTGPRLQRGGEYGKLPKTAENEQSIKQFTEELTGLKELNNRGALDPKGYKRMVAVEKKIGDLQRENLSTANLVEASDELQAAYMADRAATLAEREAASNLDAWAKPTRDRFTGDVIPAQRDQRLKDVSTQWKNRVTKMENTKAVIEGLQSGSETVRTKMAAISGSVDNFWNDIYKQRGIAETLREEIAQIDDLVRTLPSDEARKTLKSISSARGVKANADQVESTLRSYRKWAGENKRVFELLAKNPDDPVYKAWAAAGLADAHMIDLELTKPGLLNDLLNASTPVWKTTVLDTFDKGYEKAAKESGLLNDMKRVDARLFPSLYGNSEAVDLLKSVSRMREPGVVDDLSKFMRGYTGFFKSYATLSPGFHVRNGISNTFAMFAAGADLKNMREGFRLWRMMDDALKKGQSLSSFVDALPLEQQSAARTAAETMLGLGNGKTDNAMEGFVRGGSNIRDNKLLDVSRNAGQKLEGSARFMLAYDSVVKGFTPDEAFNRTRRYLIDYSEKSILDESMRDIIPFWTWMSRNLPLQIVNRWANPKPYLMYEKFSRNLNQSLGEGEVTPGYLAEGDAINLGGSNYLTLDMPFSRIDDQIRDLTDPGAMLGYVNPGIKVPLEMMFNKNTFTGENFDNKFVPVKGAMMALLPALQAAGQIEYNAKGEPMMREKAAYAVNSLIPVMGRADRLTAGGVQGGNAMNAFLGVPVRTASSGSQDAERYARLAQLQAMEARRKNLGE